MVTYDFTIDKREASRRCTGQLDGGRYGSGLNDARRWAEHTRDMTYANVIQLTEELSHQIPFRKAGVPIRKLPDIDSQLLTKTAKSQSPSEVCQSLEKLPRMYSSPLASLPAVG